MEGNGETGKDCDLIRPAAFILHIIRFLSKFFIDSTVMSTFNQVFFNVWSTTTAIKIHHFERKI